MVDALRKGLAEAGFVEGHNLTIDYAWSEGQNVRLSPLAAELVGRNVTVIVSSAINATTRSGHLPTLAASSVTDRACPTWLEVMQVEPKG